MKTTSRVTSISFPDGALPMILRWRPSDWTAEEARVERPQLGDAAAACP
jgi:hypothetical protein